MKPGTASLLLLSASAPGVPESITMATAADSHWSFYRPFSDLGSDGSLGCCARKSPFSPGLGENSFASFSFCCSPGRFCPALGAGSVCSAQGVWCWELAENGIYRSVLYLLSHLLTFACFNQHLLAAHVAPAVMEEQRTVLFFLFMLPGFVLIAVMVDVH